MKWDREAQYVYQHDMTGFGSPSWWGPLGDCHGAEARISLRCLSPTPEKIGPEMVDVGGSPGPSRDRRPTKMEGGSSRTSIGPVGVNLRAPS